jgi:hypothetical protein
MVLTYASPLFLSAELIGDRVYESFYPNPQFSAALPFFIVDSVNFRYHISAVLLNFRKKLFFNNELLLGT